MCPTAEENEQMMEGRDSQLREQLEFLVDKLPTECDAMEKPRFVHAILVIPNGAGEENGKIQKVSLKRQLDSDLIESPNDKMDTVPGKRRIQEKIEFYEKMEIPKLAKKMNGKNDNNGCEEAVENGNVIDGLFAFELEKNSPHFEAEIDVIAEAVRILREAGEMLDEKLRKIDEGKGRFEPEKAMENNARMPLNLAESPKQQILKPTAILEQPRQRPQKLTFSSGFSFPSELRKYRSATIVESS